MTGAAPQADFMSPAAGLDGRRARRERGRTAVVDALFALLQEGEGLPAVEAIAERAGVSVSSVFRYFDGLDDLRERTIERYFERFAPLFEITNIGEGDRSTRVGHLVDSRLNLYVAIHPIAQIVRQRAAEAPTGAALPVL